MLRISRSCNVIPWPPYDRYDITASAKKTVELSIFLLTTVNYHKISKEKLNLNTKTFFKSFHFVKHETISVKLIFIFWLWKTYNLCYKNTIANGLKTQFVMTEFSAELKWRNKFNKL